MVNGPLLASPCPAPTIGMPIMLSLLLLVTMMSVVTTIITIMSRRDIVDDHIASSHPLNSGCASPGCASRVGRRGRCGFAADWHRGCGRLSL
jgi:hypothetical protein